MFVSHSALASEPIDESAPSRGWLSIAKARASALKENGAFSATSVHVGSSFMQPEAAAMMVSQTRDTKPSCQNRVQFGIIKKKINHRWV